MRRGNSRFYAEMLGQTRGFAPADPMPAEIAALRDCAQPVWIFAYGSLMWDPDFPHVEAPPALLHGWHRGFCLYSFDYRGTRARPGLVLGLDRGGACPGLAVRPQPRSTPPAIDRPWLRAISAPAAPRPRCVPGPP